MTQIHRAQVFLSICLIYLCYYDVSGPSSDRAIERIPRIFIYLFDLVNVTREKLPHFVSGCIHYCRKKFCGVTVHVVAFVDEVKLSREVVAELRNQNM